MVSQAELFSTGYHSDSWSYLNFLRDGMGLFNNSLVLLTGRCSKVLHSELTHIYHPTGIQYSETRYDWRRFFLRKNSCGFILYKTVLYTDILNIFFIN